MPIGALLGGFGAAGVGITPMLCIATGGTLLSAGWFFLVPQGPSTDLMGGSDRPRESGL
jgi:hypothetical protein